jgi:hypothetical protein
VNGAAPAAGEAVKESRVQMGRQRQQQRQQQEQELQYHE